MATHTVNARSVVFHSGDGVLKKSLQIAKTSEVTVSSTGVPARDLPRAGSSISTFYSRVHCLHPKYLLESITNVISRGIVHHFRRNKFYQTLGTYTPTPSETSTACGLEVSGADPSFLDGVYELVASSLWVYGTYQITYLGEWGARVLWDSNTTIVYYYETDPDVWVNNLEEEGAIPTITPTAC